jgi:protein gp37
MEKNNISGTTVTLPLELISRWPEVQPREELDRPTLTTYTDLYRDDSDRLPPVIVFQDGIDYVLADGFHRVEAALQAGCSQIAADVRPGTLRDAILHASGANKHGKSYSNADKRRIVTRLLEDPEWSQWSDNAIARHCGVTHEFVRRLRRSLATVASETPSLSDQEKLPRSLITVISETPSRTYRTKHGTTTTMDTRRIGRSNGTPAPAGGDLASPGEPESSVILEDSTARPKEAGGADAPTLSPAPPPESDEPRTVGAPFAFIRETPDDKRSVFNRVNENIDWAKWSWNPVTGCEHNCVYCYARDIAERFYQEGFRPTFRPERLSAPQNTPLPKQAEGEIGWRNVFVCSMADLFGKWVPQEWIDAVLEQVWAAPQWNFLFLTKFPQRLSSITWPPNAWVGTTVDEQYRVKIAEKAFREVEARVKWLSCEPLRERLTFSSLDMFDWVVLGGQSASRQAPAMQPEWDWVKHLMQQAWASNCMVYWKPNLAVRPQEYPNV